jgi:molecular chaperone GrpE|tara:strand:+ start:541 stop:1047 length:507 start_codon:yes stop_codon:yes gene_type:complete
MDMANSKKKSTKPKSPTLKNQIKSLNDELKDEKDKFLRLFAEFENFRKRTAKERLDLFKSASSELMTALIPVADDMDRAFNEFKKSENENLIKGFELIYNKLNDTLKANGLTVIIVNKGDVFDSEKHEAITQIKATDKKMVGKVVDVIETGYSLGEKILRYPKVVVAN